MKKISESGKKEIKERFNSISQGVQFDTKTLVALVVKNAKKTEDLEELNLDQIKL